MTQSLNEESRKHIEQFADEALAQLESIAETAKGKLYDGRTPGSDALANINTMTSSSAIQRLDKIGQENRESYQVLVAEPAIARVVVVDEEGEEKTYYICRTTPVSGFPNLASYRAPVGRLASLAIGTEFTLPNGTVVEVLERAQLRPNALAGGWDSRDTVVEAEHFGPFTIESLRALLTAVAGEEASEDILSQLLAEESVKANIIDGVRRSVITKMGLRDQPILDQYQDEIFRRPIDNRLLILGPPGTGKTTTLIRRLGQKLDTAYLDEGEQRLVETIASAQGIAHANNWLMFTPTELLKQYLKEAFAREGVPASDQRIRTWQDYRRELARNVFGVLRRASGSGTFVLKDGLTSMTDAALERPIQWFDDFDEWQRKAYVQELHEAATLLHDAKTPDVLSLGARLQDILSRAADGALAAMFGSLSVEIAKVQALVSSLKEGSDAKIKAALNLQLKRNRAFLDELARMIDSLQQGQATEEDDQDDPDADEEEDITASRTGRTAALNAYMQAVRAQARAAASKRTVSKTSRNGKIIEWLGERSLTEADRVEVGASLLVQASARRFVNPVKRYLEGIPKRYRAFRRERQPANTWYRHEGFEARDIHPLELDIVLLAILRAAGDLLSRPNVQRDIDSPAWSSLQPILGHYCNQILVDEATDFSPIQLASMAALTHPRLRSFFACGDFNQRLTTWGARSADDLKWVFADFDIKEITVSYRQSKQLNDLARAMIRAVGGTEQNASLPAHMDSMGVAPALLEHATNAETIVGWLADRIREIERFVGQLPSTAIFVNTEDDVAPVAEALNTALAEHNIQVIACREGQAVGQESNVRVFDIQHIKGLEFEAVFFVSIDQLATLHPALFDKYLYVGTTRAATYLGVTCQGSLPSAIESLRPHFCQDWQQGD
ncbi:ATP-binding domain-containing protein [Klebsiella quasipneumoniae]|jgi:DNA polymerase III delta prime subunit|uniref:DNA 3'-5' helicase II n=1 Tax=Klebsiella quasipneumoniae subsp. similipneumoniae TaxID=1463164 RepID=A0AAE4MV60_9ENTR|nr:MULTISPECIES: ATP-binding domain-containing protein [Klebsiella]MCD9963095.1 ATP-binding domain-containing protein [Klebsiella quasipneumoniae subsp. similipneumoniae]MCE0026666.1 ATP-binding domain-containing protein [Klebsiella quasipneumoniae subsp. similipneumoniae]MDL5482083.1 ATP-binding domain-containing protein [Klebsiella quasipneumoniae]MDR4607240.1 ATP-binding domain-containing protein [Klebsiella quasipneumoniae]MDV0613305.1 ATP-binding domain-containing protein [Klebsiella quas